MSTHASVLSAILSSSRTDLLLRCRYGTLLNVNYLRSEKECAI
ncbi:hypothetical protein PC116_g30417 [Phytophthora cactorum]|nr:hypothetical protein PC116_g30417 [Phytophthora cactorum]